MIRLSGRLRSSLIIGVQGIRARKLRTLLSMTSLFLGVLAVVTVQAGAEIAEQTTIHEMEILEGRDGTLLLSLPPQPQAIPVTLDTFRGHPDAIVTTSVNAIIGEPGVKPVNPGGAPFDAPGGYGGYGRPAMACDATGFCVPRGADSQTTGQVTGQAVELSLTAMSGDVRQFRPYRLQSGQWLEFTSAPSLAPRIVVNTEAAKGFAQHRVPAEMRVEGATANATPQLVGVVDDGRYEPAAYVRLDELLNWLPSSQAQNDPQSGPGAQVMLAPGRQSLARTLQARLVAGGAQADQLQVRPIESMKEAEKQLAIMRWIFLAMASLVLLIGVAGILNVGLATVGERIEEFALRRAVGTTRSLLAAIVLAETLLTGLFTAGVAIGTAALALNATVTVFGSEHPALQTVTFPWQAGVAGVVAGLAAGLLGGFVPALRAARIPIAVVMRA